MPGMLDYDATINRFAKVIKLIMTSQFIPNQPNNGGTMQHQQKLEFNNNCTGEAQFWSCNAEYSQMIKFIIHVCKTCNMQLFLKKFLK